MRLTSEFLHPPEGRSNAAGLFLADATLAKVPLTVLSFGGNDRQRVTLKLRLVVA